MFPHSSQFYAELYRNINIILEDSIVLHQYSTLDNENVYEAPPVLLLLVFFSQLSQCFDPSYRESIGYRISMQIDDDLNVHLLHHNIVSYFGHHTKYFSQDFSEFQEKEQNKKQMLLMSLWRRILHHHLVIVIFYPVLKLLGTNFTHHLNLLSHDFFLKKKSAKLSFKSLLTCWH